ncbi:ParM/StbA family protein [Halotia wernerae UHCC 0503]|nr:ParM/StbA family protein [Halotia wernerae UHCC 0503]
MKTTQMSDNLPISLLTVDPGMSDTKIIYRVTRFASKLFMMSPEVTEIPHSAIDFYKSQRIIAPNPENESWVEYDGILYAVGSLAHTIFNARVEHQQGKAGWAISKILAATGVMAVKEGLPNSFDLALAIPLPFGEWVGRSTFQRDLQKALSEFSFCDRKLNINLKVFICVPEGGGHVMYRKARIGSDFNQYKIISFMWGYRDISIVKFDQGVMSGHTEPMGFMKLIELIQDRITGNNSRDRERMLLETVHQYGKNINDKNVKHLTIASKPSHKQEQALLLAEIIRACRDEYWRRVTLLLNRHFPPDLYEVMLGGGCIDYYRNELKTFLTQNFPKSDVSWGADLEQDVKITFGIAEKSKGMCARLTDVYALSVYLMKQVYKTT